jgi:hypothetical protein
MHSALAVRRAVGAVVLALALGTAGCGRWTPAKSYEVPVQGGDPQATYGTVLAVAGAEKYKVVSQDPATKKIRLESKVSGSDAGSKSFIDVQVAVGTVWLNAAGNLVRDGKVHKKLSTEMAKLEGKLKARLQTGAAVAAAPAGTVPVPAAAAPAPVADASTVPQAWSEPAYDPSVWGNGNFTCLPVKVPAEHQAQLTLQLSNGEKADLHLSLAYAPELCRSPAQCKVAGGGCPALGIGDPERVHRLAGRLSRNEVGAHATLLDSGKPVANIDLSKHGSIVQAMSDIKR